MDSLIENLKDIASDFAWDGYDDKFKIIEKAIKEIERLQEIEWIYQGLQD